LRVEDFGGLRLESNKAERLESNRFNVTCECNKEEINDDDDDGLRVTT